MLLDYFIIKDRLFLLAISKKSADITDIGIDKDFISKISGYRNLIKNYNPAKLSNDYNQFFIKKSHDLYIKLIRPIKKNINGKQLLIIPDRELNLIPFETLITDTISERGQYYNNYLVFQNSITILYSPDQLFTEQKYLSQRSRFFGFAPNYNDSINHGIYSLPGAIDEMESISDYFNSTIYVNEKASKIRFLDCTDEADILHLALHTVISDIKPLYSALYFSSDDNPGIDTMFTYEILDRKLRSKLLILSGCNTGYGELKYGEGVINLARSFIYSGVDNIIVTQWEVADKSSSVLMKYFYKNLTQGGTVDMALQKAKVDFLLNEDPVKHHPYYWSGYISVGKPVKYIHNLSLTYFLIILFTVLSFLFLILYIKKKRNN
jgi:CHAT domain-containing protein